MAPRLLGCIVRSSDDDGAVSVRLTEVEAYAGEGDDPSSHAHRGPTARNASMFAAGGTVYVYFTYGMHWCANLVCEPLGRASAVLLRAGEVVEGVELATRRRARARGVNDLAAGPAKLAVALGLDRDDDGADVTRRYSTITVHRPVAGREATVMSGPRVGVSGPGAATAWRFWLAGEPTVSRWRPGVTRRPR